MNHIDRHSRRRLTGAIALGFIAGLLPFSACAPVGGGGAAPPAEPAQVRDEDRGAERARADAARVLDEVRAAAAVGDTLSALVTLLQASPEPVPTTPESLDLARSLTERLDGDALAQVLRGVPLGTPLAIPAQVAYARVLRLAGDPEAARGFARAALESGAGGEEAELARAIVEGRPLPGLPAAKLGALLPLSGSPGLQRYARAIQEGMEAAIAASPLGVDGVEFQVLDTGGDGAAAAGLIRSLEGSGTIAVLGPLESTTLRAALQGRSGRVPLMSPTVWEVPDEAPAVYSLGNDDRRGPAVLAEWALAAGITQVVVLGPSRGPGSGEVGIFRQLFEAGGGSVLRSLTYEPGTSFFGDQMNVIRGLKPQGLVLPIPAEDVQALAGQAAYFALDTLGVQLMGTGGWTDEGVLADVNPRLLEGVAVATPIRPGPDSPGYRRFVEAYEERFQRTLVEPAAPALGYDAATLLLKALENGARDPEGVSKALAEVRDLPGATGILSVEAGRVVRAHQMVCFAGGERLLLEQGQRPVQTYRPFQPNPQTGELPEGPGHPDGFVCPQLAPADSMRVPADPASLTRASYDPRLRR